MKKLLILLFSLLILPFSVYASDVYYCSEDETIGFKPSNNYSSENYNPMKFKILIDFENKDVISETLFMDKTRRAQKCLYDDKYDTLYCMNDLGRSFSINKLNLKYMRSNIFNIVGLTDDMLVAYGTC